MIAAVNPEPFVWKIPGTCFGARMFPTIPKSAADIIAMGKDTRAHETLLDECGWLGIAECPKTFHVKPSLGGSEPCMGGTEAKHMHFIHWGDSGTAILQAPVSSQPFFDFALTQLPRVGRGFGFPEACVPVFAELLADERSHLLPELAWHERRFLQGDTFAKFVTERLVWIG